MDSGRITRLDQVLRASIYTSKDIARGYSVDMKRVFLAYFAETVIVIASLIGAWLFAVQYGNNNAHVMTMMMLAPAAYAVVEFCRVPLAISVRKPSYPRMIKLIIIIGLIGAACVTIKSMSQLGEIMFRPRLVEVVHAREKLVQAQDGVAIMDKQIGDADAVVAQHKAEFEAADHQLATSTEQLGHLPKQDCAATSGVNRNGRAYKGIRCVSDPRIAPLTAIIATATTNRNAASVKLAEALAQRGQLDRTPSEFFVWRSRIIVRR
jgi:hypothetical protein